MPDWHRFDTNSGRATTISRNLRECERSPAERKSHGVSDRRPHRSKDTRKSARDLLTDRIADRRACNMECSLRVIRDWVEPATKRDRVRYAPKADKSPHRGEMTRWAALMRCSRVAAYFITSSARGEAWAPLQAGAHCTVLALFVVTSPSQKRRNTPAAETQHKQI